MDEYGIHNNTMLMSDFRPDAEICLFSHCGLDCEVDRTCYLPHSQVKLPDILDHFSLEIKNITVKVTKQSANEF